MYGYILRQINADLKRTNGAFTSVVSASEGRNSFIGVCSVRMKVDLGLFVPRDVPFHYAWHRRFSCLQNESRWSIKNGIINGRRWNYQRQERLGSVEYQQLVYVCERERGGKINFQI